MTYSIWKQLFLFPLNEFSVHTIPWEECNAELSADNGCILRLRSRPKFLSDQTFQTKIISDQTFQTEFNPDQIFPEQNAAVFVPLGRANNSQ